MNKCFFLLPALAVLLNCSGADLRLDVRGLPEKGAVRPISAGCTVSTVVRGEDKIRTVIIPPGNGWKPFEVKIDTSGVPSLILVFRSTNDTAMLLDDISVSGGTLANGTFETFSGKGRFGAWKSGKTSIVTDPRLVRSGKAAARVRYKEMITQTVKVTAPEVTVRGFVRYETAPEAAAVQKLPKGANIVFDPTMDKTIPLVISVGRLELHPTFENCSVYINRLPAERGKKLKAAFFFRKQGTKAFQEALPPSEIRQENAWRGSLLFLEENTPYDFKAVITGEGNYRNEIKGSFRTLNSKVPFETCVIPAGPMKTPIRSGTPGKYIRYTSNGATVTAPGPETFAVFNLEKKENIIFDNMVIDARGAQIVFNLLDSKNIIIRNCEIFNFGRDAVGTVRYGVDEYYSGGARGKDGKLLYDDLAFKLVKTRNVLIERCLVHDPVFSAQTWVHAHPSGPGCLKVTDTRGTVVRWNDFAGRDKARFIDHIIGPPNTALRGGFGRDADVYGNLMVFSNDDGAELEGGGMNIRCYGNRIEGVLSGISTGPISLGPTYVMANLFTNPGDDTGRGGQAYKNGGGKAGMCHTRGTLYLLHNTVSDTWPGTYGVGNFSIPHKDYYPVCKAYLRNNILRASGPFFHRLWPTFKTDCDGDLLERIDVPDATPEQIKTWKERSAEYIRQAGIERHAIRGKAAFQAPRRGNYALKLGTPGCNAAMKVNNFHLRNIGAYEGYAGEWFPKRPLDLTGDRTELHWGKGDASARTFTVTPGKSLKGRFRIFCSDGFFTVTPAAGTFVPGKKLNFTVELDPSAMKEPKRYSGVILVRSAEGFSYPVTLFADRRIPPQEAIADPVRFVRAKRISAKGGTQTYEVTVSEEAPWFLMARGKVLSPKTKGKLTFEFGDLKGDDLLVPLKWSGGMMTLRGAEFSRLRPVYLKKGRNTFTFRNLKDVAVDEVILTREPETLVRNRDYPVLIGK